MCWTVILVLIVCYALKTSIKSFNPTWIRTGNTRKQESSCGCILSHGQTSCFINESAAWLPFVGSYRTFLIGQETAAITLTDHVSGFVSSI